MSYLNELILNINQLDLVKVRKLKELMILTHKKNGKIFICGNGGSAANSNHIANDLMLGFKKKIGFKFISLSSNLPVITCIANDISYDEIYSQQIKILAEKKDLLIVLSGSGNSKNIIQAIKIANKKKVNVFGIVAYAGGGAKKLMKNYIHIKTFDMQIAEDLQMVIMNFIMKEINEDIKKRKQLKKLFN